MQLAQWLCRGFLRAQVEIGDRYQETTEIGRYRSNSEHTVRRDRCQACPSAGIANRQFDKINPVWLNESGAFGRSLGMRRLRGVVNHRHFANGSFQLKYLVLSFLIPFLIVPAGAHSGRTRPASLRRKIPYRRTIIGLTAL